MSLACSPFRADPCRKITRQIGQNPIQERSRDEIIRETVSVWKAGGAYPTPDTHVLKLPFSFTLPEKLLPSCQFGKGSYRSGTIMYSVEVVGTRSGLHFNKRIQRPIPVIPYDLAGAGLHDELRSGWTGATNCYKSARDIRRGLWGEYSNANISVRAILNLNNPSVNTMTKSYAAHAPCP